MSEAGWKSNLFSAYDRHTAGRSSPQREGGQRAAAVDDDRGTGADVEKQLLAQHLGMDMGEDEHLMWIAEMVSPRAVRRTTSDSQATMSTDSDDGACLTPVFERAWQALKAPLPEDWDSYETERGELYYHKPATGET